MKTFTEWLKLKEGAVIVSCKDLKNPDFQISGAMSDLKCSKKKKKLLR